MGFWLTPWLCGFCLAPWLFGLLAYALVVWLPWVVVGGCDASNGKWACLAHTIHDTASQDAKKQKGLRDRNSPTCTLSQNGYGDITTHMTSVAYVFQTFNVAIHQTNPAIGSSTCHPTNPPLQRHHRPIMSSTKRPPTHQHDSSLTTQPAHRLTVAMLLSDWGI